MPGARRGVVAVLLAALAAGAAAPTPPNTTPCVVELLGEDAAGNRVLQTAAYVLEQPGLILTSLTEATRHRSRWERLLVAPDLTLPGPAPATSSMPVAEVALADPSRDLLVLRVSRLEACATSGSSGAPAGSAALRTGAAPPAEGEEVTGLRTREGYRSRVFRGVIDRLTGVGDRLDLLRIRMPDAAGAGPGFLFDRDRRLVGSILPTFPGADASHACAIATSAEGIAAAVSDSAGESLDALRLRPPAGFARTPNGLFSQALLAREDQQDQALRLLDEVEGLAGASAGLLMERGALRFKAGRLDGAIDDFSRAARLDGRRHLAHYNLGIALGTAGRFEAAVEALGLARELDPRHAMTRFQLALALEAAHRPESALEECDHLGGLDPALAESLRSILSD